MATSNGNATVMGGIPATNSSLFHAIRFNVGDPVALLRVNGSSTLILRDIEMHRAKQHARADHVACPADFEPESGLSGDRETATAQAAAEFLHQRGVKSVTADRTLPLIFAELIRERGIDVNCDYDMGVAQRRVKDETEIQWLREAQSATEDAIQLACEMIAKSTATADGLLQFKSAELTSERVRSEVDIYLMKRGYATVPSIVACGPAGADCHNLGTGPIRTGQPVIVDIFPCNRATGYNGDCTRTVVHGEISDELQKMHATVVAAKQAGQEATRSGVTGEQVHQAVIDRIVADGFKIGIPDDSEPDEYCGMVHGTGHGIGLDVHEPPLLDFKGPELVVGDALTIEPGLYCKAIGGIRIEDLVIVKENGIENLNKLHEGLQWI